MDLSRDRQVQVPGPARPTGRTMTLGPSDHQQQCESIPTQSTLFSAAEPNVSSCAGRTVDSSGHFSAGHSRLFTEELDSSQHNSRRLFSADHHEPLQSLNKPSCCPSVKTRTKIPPQHREENALHEQHGLLLCRYQARLPVYDRHKQIMAVWSCRCQHKHQDIPSKNRREFSTYQIFQVEILS